MNSTLRSLLVRSGSAALVGLSLVSALAAPLDEDLVPGGTVLSRLDPSSEVETFRVVAPAGSSLKFDLRPVTGGGFVPVIQSLALNGDSLAPPAASSKGVSKASVLFPEDGELVLRIASAGAAGGDYRLKTKLKPARRTAFLDDVVPDGTTDIDLFAPAAALATVVVKASRGSSLVPRIAGLDGPDGATSPGSEKTTSTAHLWKKVPMEAGGAWTLSVGGEAGSEGVFAGLVKWKVAAGPDLDFRDVVSTPGVEGTYTIFLIAPASETRPEGALFTGTLTFGAGGAVTTDLGSLAVVPDAEAPTGFTLVNTPVTGDTGEFVTDETGTLVSVALDLGDDDGISMELRLAGDGGLLLPAPDLPPGSPRGFLFVTRDPPTKASLAGSWFYGILDGDGSGSSEVEVGTMTFGASGSVSGLGGAVSITQDEFGDPVVGSVSPVLRGGSFDLVARDFTMTTVPNLFGVPDQWTANALFSGNFLLGRGTLAEPGAAIRLFVKQGTGLTTADAAGDYLHIGLGTGGTPGLRFGVLALDGAGGVSGTDTVVDLSGQGGGGTVETTGSYTVTAQGTATLTLNGGATANGVIGPGAAYLAAVGFGDSGFSLDLLLSLDTAP